MVRYAEMVCDRCGAIYPANEMVKRAEDQGWNTSRVGGGFGEGVHTENWVDVFYCKDCAPKRAAERKAGFRKGILVGLLGVVFVPVAGIAAIAAAIGMLMLGHAMNPSSATVPKPMQSVQSQPATTPAATAPSATEIAARPDQPVDATASTASSGADINAAAPGFDCARAATDAERLVCSNPELSRADVQLGDAYRRRLVPLAPNSPEQLALVQEQRSWLKGVRNACATVDCLTDAYATRTAALSQATGER